MSCEECENIERLKIARKGAFKGYYAPSCNVNQIVYDPDEKCFGLWDDGGGDDYTAGIKFYYVKFCPYCGEKLKRKIKRKNISNTQCHSLPK